MKTLQNSGASVRNSFINEFAFGDKSKAIHSLIKRAHESRRFDRFFSDDIIYERIACTQASVHCGHISKARVSA